jgi:glucose-1-phosphate cytidylyltransferase
LHASDITIDIRKNKIETYSNHCEDWRVTLIDTGPDTMTGGRLKRALPFVKDEEIFCFTYGDGVADVEIDSLIKHHRQSGKLATLTAVQPAGKFGALQIDSAGSVLSFAEKPKGDARWVNGGFFVLSPKVGEYLKDDATVWEREPLEEIARRGELSAYQHPGFWQPMDTVHDKSTLESLWGSGRAPWKVWK